MDGRKRRVVITGASSGIGRATAEAFAKEGAELVLAAREEGRLEEAKLACEALGARALAVAADVAEAEDVEALGRRAIEAFGGFDVWVNNAGVIAFGAVDETPAEDHERIVRTNLCGTIFGSRVALRHFRQRGGPGTLVNVSSIVSKSAQPFSSAYTASKWGISGFDEALRAELAGEPGIHVCTVMPAFIDTPIFAHAANYTGREVGTAGPTYVPEDVARAIVGLADRPQAKVTVGDVGRLIILGHELAPELSNRVARSVVEGAVLGEGRAPMGSGNLHAPTGSMAIAGGHAARHVSGRTFDRSLRGVALGALGALGLGVLAAMGRRGRHRRLANGVARPAGPGLAYAAAGADPDVARALD